LVLTSTWNAISGPGERSPGDVASGDLEILPPSELSPSPSVAGTAPPAITEQAGPPAAPTPTPMPAAVEPLLLPKHLQPAPHAGAAPAPARATAPAAPRRIREELRPTLVLQEAQASPRARRPMHHAGKSAAAAAPAAKRRTRSSKQDSRSDGDLWECSTRNYKPPCFTP
jgi:hypothetical protein